MDFHRIKNVLVQQHTLAPHEWKGAVLFLCNKDYVFLIKRSEQMPTHSGQIAFVGGHKCPDEDDPWIVAQREYEEETHHLRSSIKFLGFLPSVLTAGQKAIVPVVAQLLIPTAQFLEEVKSNGEWDDIIAYPWHEITKEESWDYGWRIGHSKFPVLFHTIRPSSYLPMKQNVKPHLLWGATASMIWTFLRLYFKA